jgi:hypothetical protein
LADDDRVIDNSAPDDWPREVRYAALVTVPDVRATIANCALRARPGVSAEQCLAFFDAITPTIAGALMPGVAPALSTLSLSKLSSVLVPVFAVFGIRASHTRSADLSIPPGLVIATALCSFARYGQTLQGAQQYDDGCLLEATLPSELTAWAGTLYIGISVASAGVTHVSGAVTIKGQMFDWGEGVKKLDHLFADLSKASIDDFRNSSAHVPLPPTRPDF